MNIFILVGVYVLILKIGHFTSVFKWFIVKQMNSFIRKKL